MLDTKWVNTLEKYLLFLRRHSKNLLFRLEKMGIVVCEGSSCCSMCRISPQSKIVIFSFYYYDLIYNFFKLYSSQHKYIFFLFLVPGVSQSHGKAPCPVLSTWRGWKLYLRTCHQFSWSVGIIRVSLPSILKRSAQWAALQMVLQCLVK